MEPAEASLMHLQMSSQEASFWILTVRSTTDTSAVGTRNAMPVNFPFSSVITLPRGARQLVVQEALETTFRLGSYFSWFTPITNMGASADGAEMTTFLAPPVMCFWAPSMVVNTPVDSTMYSAPASAHLMSLGSRSLNTVIFWPLT